MKNIKFIPLFLIALSLIVSSCAIDDDDAIIGDTIITKTVSFADTEVIVPASTSPYNAAVLVSEAFGTNALIEYTVNGVSSGATIPFGNVSGGLPLDVSEEGLIYEVTMTDISVLEKPDNVDAVIDQASKTITVIVLTVPDADPNALQVVMTWNNPAQNDWDLWITDSPPTVGIVASQTVSPLEDVSFSNFNADGSYHILPRDWASVDEVVNVLMVAVHPDGTVETFSEAITSGGDFYYMVDMEKVGSNYTLTQVPAVSVF
jgi:hypothetical protein